MLGELQKNPKKYWDDKEWNDKKRALKELLRGMLNRLGFDNQLDIPDWKLSHVVVESFCIAAETAQTALLVYGHNTKRCKENIRVGSDLFLCGMIRPCPLHEIENDEWLEPRSCLPEEKHSSRDGGFDDD